MALKTLAWDTTSNKIKKTAFDPSGGATLRADAVALTNATTSVSVTFSSSIGTASYSVVCTMKNTTDTSPQFQPMTITFQDQNGFIAKWNAPLDSANYSLNYIATPYV